MLCLDVILEKNGADLFVVTGVKGGCRVKNWRSSNSHFFTLQHLLTLATLKWQHRSFPENYIKSKHLLQRLNQLIILLRCPNLDLKVSADRGAFGFCTAYLCNHICKVNIGTYLMHILDQNSNRFLHSFHDHWIRSLESLYSETHQWCGSQNI